MDYCQGIFNNNRVKYLPLCPRISNVSNFFTFITLDLGFVGLSFVTRKVIRSLFFFPTHSLSSIILCKRGPSLGILPFTRNEG